MTQKIELLIYLRHNEPTLSDSSKPYVRKATVGIISKVPFQFAEFQLAEFQFAENPHPDPNPNPNLN